MDQGDIIDLRTKPDAGLDDMDEFDLINESRFQKLSLDFRPENQSPDPWPASFERHLNSIPSATLAHVLKHDPALSRFNGASIEKGEQLPFPSPLPEPVLGEDYAQFRGSGFDSAAYTVRGHVHLLAHHAERKSLVPTFPCQRLTLDKVPGWRRISFMKYRGPEPDEVREGQDIWAFEGVILSGGNVMFGRYWDPTETDFEADAAHLHDPEYRRTSRLTVGPFIYWTELETPGKEAGR